MGGSNRTENVRRRALLVLDGRDNVGTVLCTCAKGEELTLPGGGTLRLVEDIPSGHKVALRPIKKGELVVKYGAAIGEATCDISAGAHVHVHNVRSLRGKARGTGEVK